MSQTTWSIGRVQIGNRVRERLGAIDELAKSIEQLGLLHPIVVRPDGQLISGFRRLKAVERLGWQEVPVTVAKNLADEDLALQAEGEENTCREQMTVKEIDAWVSMRKERFEAEAKERQKDAGEHGKEGGRGKKKPSGKSATRVSKKSRDAKAAGTGLSGKTIEKLEQIKEAVKSEPALEPLMDSLKREEKYSPAHEIACEWAAQKRKTYQRLWQWGWENSQIVKFAKTIEQLKEDEQVPARSLVLSQKMPVPQGGAQEVAENLLAMPAPKRAHIYQLHSSDATQDREAAFSLASGNQPTDARVPRIINMAKDLRGFVKETPDDPANDKIKKCADALEQLAELLRDRLQERLRA